MRNVPPGIQTMSSCPASDEGLTLTITDIYLFLLWCLLKCIANTAYRAASEFGSFALQKRVCAQIEHLRNSQCNERLRPDLAGALHSLLQDDHLPVHAS